MHIVTLVIAALVGATLALRFKVLVLIPAIGIAVALVVAIGIAQNLGGWSITLGTVLAAVALQFGYLSGIATANFVVPAVRGLLREL
jgi:hypothetical protein